MGQMNSGDFRELSICGIMLALSAVFAHISKTYTQILIFLSFKDAKGSRSLLLKQIKLALLAEYQRFSDVFVQLSHIDKTIYEQTLAELLDYNTGSLSGIDNALFFKDIENFIVQYRVLLETLPSYYDLKDENSYHMMMLGICVSLSGDYEISSNREWGEGRSDILLRSRNEAYPHVVMEFKYTKDTSYDLGQLAKEALDQIEDKQYMSGLYGSVLGIGLGHRGKCVEAVWKEL